MLLAAVTAGKQLPGKGEAVERAGEFAGGENSPAEPSDELANAQRRLESSQGLTGMAKNSRLLQDSPAFRRKTPPWKSKLGPQVWTDGRRGRAKPVRVL